MRFFNRRLASYNPIQAATEDTRAQERSTEGRTTVLNVGQIIVLLMVMVVAGTTDVVTYITGACKHTISGQLTVFSQHVPWPVWILILGIAVYILKPWRVFRHEDEAGPSIAAADFAAQDRSEMELRRARIQKFVGGYGLLGACAVLVILAAAGMAITNASSAPVLANASCKSGSVVLFNSVVPKPKAPKPAPRPTPVVPSPSPTVTPTPTSTPTPTPTPSPTPGSGGGGSPAPAVGLTASATQLPAGQPVTLTALGDHVPAGDGVGIEWVSTSPHQEVGYARGSSDRASIAKSGRQVLVAYIWNPTTHRAVAMSRYVVVTWAAAPVISPPTPAPAIDPTIATLTNWHEDAMDGSNQARILITGGPIGATGIITNAPSQSGNAVLVDTLDNKPICTSALLVNMWSGSPAIPGQYGLFCGTDPASVSGGFETDANGFYPIQWQWTYAGTTYKSVTSYVQSAVPTDAAPGYVFWVSLSNSAPTNGVETFTIHGYMSYDSGVIPPVTLFAGAPGNGVAIGSCQDAPGTNSCTITITDGPTTPMSGEYYAGTPQYDGFHTQMLATYTAPVTVTWQ